MWHLLVLIGAILAGALFAGCFGLAIYKMKLWGTLLAGIMLIGCFAGFVIFVDKSLGVVLASSIAFLLGVALALFYGDRKDKTSQHTTRSS